MAWDGSGNFSRTNGVNTGDETWQDDAATSVKIRADRHDTHDQDLATGISECLTKNNESKPTNHFLPNITATYTLGSATYKWKDIHLSGDITAGGDITVGGTVDGVDIANGVVKKPDTDAYHHRVGNTFLCKTSILTYDHYYALSVAGGWVSITSTEWDILSIVPSTARSILVDIDIQNRNAIADDLSVVKVFTRVPGSGESDSEAVTQVGHNAFQSGKANDKNQTWTRSELFFSGTELSTRSDETGSTTSSVNIWYRGYKTD